MTEALAVDDQCPTCGRMSADWSANRAPGNKRTQRNDAHIDRTADYRTWRRTFRHDCYVSDIDQVEWRITAGKPTPVVVLELTRIDGEMPPPRKYLDAIVTRMTKRDAQGATIVALADRLGVDAVIVLFRENLREFWLWNLSRPTQWFHRSRDQYEEWLTRHRGR